MDNTIGMYDEVLITFGEAGCKVSHEFMVVLPGRQVRFVNRTEEEVLIHVSEDGLFKSPRFNILPGEDTTLTVGEVQRGIYPYAVFCKCNGEFCTGSSMPIIIVPR